MADTYTVMGVTYDTSSGLPISSIENGATYSSGSEHTHLIIFSDGRTERHPVSVIPKGGAIIAGSETDGGKYQQELLKIEEAKEKALQLKAEQEAIEKKKSDAKLRIGPLEGHRPSPDQSITFRYPEDTITNETDYVFFQFGKYQAPFSQDQEDLRKADFERKGKKDNVKEWADMGKNERQIWQQNYMNESGALTRYNNVTLLKPENDAGDAYESIMLPIPQDLGNEIGQVWQGKQWTATGRAATAALGAGNFSDAGRVLSDIGGVSKAIQASLTEMALNVLPGVGGNISFNDLTGATQGIVINPNAELMYDSPEMREIGMVFKMVPRTPKESKIIRRICQAFRRHSMPMFGGVDADSSQLNKKATALAENIGMDIASDKGKIELGNLSNFIRVPNLCKFTFMHGNKVHPYLVQFKPCAINKVEVTYTPDGNYATYGDGAPAAVELRLNFMETKTIFADEVNYDGVSY